MAYCGRVFFETSYYPANVSFENKDIGKFLRSIKNEPEKYKKEELMNLFDEFFIKLVEAYNKKNNVFTFDLEFANNLCCKFYFPYLNLGM